MYKMILQKYEENKNYDAELLAAKENQSNRFNQMDFSNYPEKFRIKALEVNLTDEEFQAVKKAVIEVM